MIVTDEPLPTPDEYRENLYSESVELKNHLLDLLADTRAHKVGLLWRLWRGKIEDFEKRYDKLFLDFVDYDKHLASYTDMVTNPFAEHLADLTNWDRSNVITQTYASSRVLFAQWESTRMLFQDINAQIHDLQNQINNNFILMIAILSLLVALASLWVSAYTSPLTATIPPVPTFSQFVLLRVSRVIL